MNKKIILSILFVSLILIFVNMVSAIPIFLIPGEANTDYSYTLNFTTNYSCSDVLLSYNTDVTTNSKGWAFVDVDVSSLSETPRHLCEYRNGMLRKVHNISDQIVNNIYAQNITANRIEVKPSVNRTRAMIIGATVMINVTDPYSTDRLLYLLNPGTGDADAFIRSESSDAGENAWEMVHDGEIYWRMTMGDGTNQGIWFTSLLRNDSGDVIDNHRTMNILHKDNGGMVGIGTTTPESLLHVTGNATIDDNIYLNGKLGININPEVEIDVRDGDIKKYRFKKNCGWDIINGYYCIELKEVK